MNAKAEKEGLTPRPKQSGEANRRQSQPAVGWAVPGRRHAAALPLLQLQQTQGNLYTQHLLRSGLLQAKLTISEPGDEFEQEADRVADQVMAASAHSAVSGASPRIQRFAGQATEDRETAPASVDRVLASSGRPLDTVLRQDMESRFGHDFSRVQVHSGAAAEQSAQDVNANAYTVGHNIVFGAGRFAPGTHEGRRLIAHELTHVVQQTNAERTYGEQSNEKLSLSSSISPTMLQKQDAEKSDKDRFLLSMEAMEIAKDCPDFDDEAISWIYQKAAPFIESSYKGLNSFVVITSRKTWKTPSTWGELDMDINFTKMSQNSSPEEVLGASERLQQHVKLIARFQKFADGLHVVGELIDWLDGHLIVRRSWEGVVKTNRTLGFPGYVCNKTKITDLPEPEPTRWFQKTNEKKRMQAKLTIGASNDPLEQEADRVADQVLALPTHTAVSGAPPHIQRVVGQPTGQAETAPASVDHVLASSGRPMEPALRQDMEQRFGHDFSRVRVHSGAAAEQSARDVNANAYTVGHNIIFGAGQFAPNSGAAKRLLAHELTHVLQQAGSGVPSKRSVQRYEAGEHAQLGETEDQFKKLATPNYIIYKVEQREMPTDIATKFAVSVEELKEANKDKLQKWKTANGKTIEGFSKGDLILIPPKINPAVKDALKNSGQMIVYVNGAKLEYGDIIAMSGDMFEDINDLLTMSQAQLEEIARLIKEEKTTGKALDTARWDKATGGRFIKYAQKNEKHFAPSNAALVKPSAVASAGDHKSEWEKFHKMALSKAQQGKKEEALLQAAFGDHYLTDAFAAGHLFNKRDAMELFSSQLPIIGKKIDAQHDERKFSKDAKGFFDAVANASWSGSVRKEFSNHQGEKYGLWWDINSSDRLSGVLQGIDLERPDLLGGVIAKATHDELNTLPSGLEVQNNKGDKWQLSGDNTLNPPTKLIAKAAVAQSQLNVLSSMNVSGVLDIASLLKKVWDYTPVPTVLSIKVIQATVKTNTDPKNTRLITAVAALITREHKLIIPELIKLGFLKKKN